MPTESAFREKSQLTQFAFNRLLQWMDDGVDSRGETYLEMRRRLVSYFERRDRPDPDALADETLNRIARTLEEQGVIATRPPAKYCYVVARFVLLEDCRRKDTHVQLNESTAIASSITSPSIQWLSLQREPALQEERLDWLDRCLRELRADQRELVVEYYRDVRRQKVDRRRRLADRLGITMNALGIRVCRIRNALMTCMERRGVSGQEALSPLASYPRRERSGGRVLPLIRK